MSNVTKEAVEEKQLVIQHFVTARPQARTQFDLAAWNRAIDNAIQMYNPNRTDLYDLYADTRLDPHFITQWEKRVENITKTKWCFSENNEVVEDICKLCQTPAFKEMLKEIMEGKCYGITVLELGTEDKAQFGKTEKELIFYSVERKHIRPEQGVITKEQYDTADGFEPIHYREGTNANYVGEIGKPKDLGLLLEIAPYVILKKGAVSDWALFVQLFGQPFRVYEYDGHDETSYAKIEKSAKDMASAPYIILPSGAKVSLLEIKNNNTGQVHQGIVDYCDKMISVRVLGNTLTTDNTNVGSNALGEVHADTQDDRYESDTIDVTDILNFIIRPILYNLGYPVADGVFHPEEVKDTAAILDRLKVLQAMKTLGTPISDDVVYEISGIEKPADYDAQKKAAEQQAAADAVPGKKFGKAGNKPPKNKDLSFSRSKWKNLRNAMSDFFDLAR